LIPVHFMKDAETSGSKQSVVLQRITLTGLVAMMAVSTDLYLPAIPQLIENLGTNISQGQLTLSIFLMGFAVGQLFYGGISDRYGRKPVLYLGLGVYLLATLACIIAPDINSLIAARFVQGIGGASAPVLARAMVADSHNRVDAARVMASIAGAMALVPAIAPVFGSWLLYFFDWRSHFVLLLVLGIFTFFGVTRLQESCKTIGAETLKLSSVFSQFGLCFGNRNFVGYALCGGATYAAMFCYISTSSFLVIGLLGLAPEYFGYTFMIVVFGYLAGAMTSSRLVGRIGVLRVLALGQLIGLLAAVLLLVLALFEINRLIPLLLAFFMVFMAGGLSLSISQMGAIAELPKAAGKASSVFGFVQIAFASVLGYVVGLFYNHSLVPTTTGVCLAVLMSGAGYLIIRSSHHGDNEPDTDTPEQG
jgi:DHA1 family bicyclomycin/chloramphenicol resistance-like MFS transporter